MDIITKYIQNRKNIAYGTEYRHFLQYFNMGEVYHIFESIKVFMGIFLAVTVAKNYVKFWLS